ncbi:MAG: IS1595 family transposase [Methylocella sp.]
MTKSIFTAPHFNDEAAAYAYVEARLWPDGPVCPHCGVIGKAGVLKGKTDRIGSHKCYACRKKFTVKVGTIFEASHIQMRDWLTAIHLLCSSKKGFSANQLSRTLGITLKSAWFVGHRIREAMRSGELAPFGSAGGDVEVDETFIGHDPDARPTPAHANPSWVEKIKVLSLVDRASGQARSFVVDSLSAKDVRPILEANIAKEARFMTDEAKRYVVIGRDFAEHGTVHHGQDEYVSPDDPSIHINALEGYFSIFKRGMCGIYQHASKRHLHRYMAEFDFRYSHRARLGLNDTERANFALAGVTGNRLKYRSNNCA